MDDVTDLTTELNRIRLDEDLAYSELAAEIGIDPSVLYRVINKPERQTWDRTIHKIRRYLESRPTSKRAPKRRRAMA
jgi:predicted transcriptional regulator